MFFDCNRWSVAILSLGNGASSKPFASDKLIHIKDRTWRSRIPTDHLLRRINVFATAVLADLHYQLKAFYSDSVDPRSILS
jgi:hypothetical protein